MNKRGLDALIGGALLFGAPTMPQEAIAAAPKVPEALVQTSGKAAETLQGFLKEHKLQLAQALDLSGEQSSDTTVEEQDGADEDQVGEPSENPKDSLDLSGEVNADSVKPEGEPEAVTGEVTEVTPEAGSEAPVKPTPENKGPTPLEQLHNSGQKAPPVATPIGKTVVV